MIEERFDHIRAEHAEAMRAIEDQVRRVLARKEGSTGIGGGGENGTPAAAVSESESAVERAVGSGTQSGGQPSTAVPARGAGGPGRYATAAGAPLLDPRWNSDLEPSVPAPPVPDG